MAVGGTRPNRSLAIAAPNWTERIPPTTSQTAGIRSSRPPAAAGSRAARASLCHGGSALPLGTSASEPRRSRAEKLSPDGCCRSVRRRRRRAAAARPRSRSAACRGRRPTPGSAPWVRTGERAFVLVPGIGVSSNYFERLAALLNDYGPVHALDLPGFGGVPHPKSRRMTIGEYADLVGTVIDELELDRPDRRGSLDGHPGGRGARVALPRPASAGRQELSTVILLGPVLYPAERQPRRWPAAGSCRPPARSHRGWRRWPCRRTRSAGCAGSPGCCRRCCSSRSRSAAKRPREHPGDQRPRDDLCPRVWIDAGGRVCCPSSRVSIIPGAAHSIMHAHADVVAQLSVAARTPSGHRTAHRCPTAAPTPRSTRPGWSELTGQVTELVGIVTDDDTLIAEGKTAQAEAVEEATEAEDPPDPAADGASDPAARGRVTSRRVTVPIVVLVPRPTDRRRRGAWSERGPARRRQLTPSAITSASRSSVRSLPDTVISPTGGRRHSQQSRSAAVALTEAVGATSSATQSRQPLGAPHRRPGPGRRTGRSSPTSVTGVGRDEAYDVAVVGGEGAPGAAARRT